MVCQWYQHSKEVNQSAVHWQRGASMARLAADKTHQFLLEGEGGGQTKGWNVPNCLVSISSSQWQGFPAVLISHTLSSGEQLACVHTHADPCHWFYNSYHLVCGIFPNSNLTASPWPRAHLWKEVQQKWLQHGPLIGNTRKDLTTEFTMRNAGGHRFQLVLNLPAVTKYTIFNLYVAITSHW